MKITFGFKSVTLAVALLSVALLFQNCSLNSEGGLNDNTSSGKSVPTVSADTQTISLPTGAVDFTVAGDCDFRSYPNHHFRFIFHNNPVDFSTVYEPVGLKCVGKRYSTTIPLTALGITSGQHGVLGINLIGESASGEKPSPEFSVEVHWALPPGCPHTVPAVVPNINDVSFYGTHGISAEDYNAEDNAIRSWPQVGTLDGITYHPDRICLQSEAMLRWPSTELFNPGEWINGNFMIIIYWHNRWISWPGTWLRWPTSTVGNSICVSLTGHSITDPNLDVVSDWAPCPGERVCMMLSSMVRKGIRYPEASPITERTNIVCTAWAN